MVNGGTRPQTMGRESDELRAPAFAAYWQVDRNVHSPYAVEGIRPLTCDAGYTESGRFEYPSMSPTSRLLTIAAIWLLLAAVAWRCRP